MQRCMVRYTPGQFSVVNPDDLFPDFNGYSVGGGLEDGGFRISLEAAGYNVVLELEAGNGLNVAEACIYIHDSGAQFAPLLDCECIVELWLRSGEWQRVILCNSMQDGLEALSKYHFFEVCNALNNVDVRDAIHQWREYAPNRKAEEYRSLTAKEKLDGSRKAQAEFIKRSADLQNAIDRRHAWINAKQEGASA